MRENSVLYVVIINNMKPNQTPSTSGQRKRKNNMKQLIRPARLPRAAYDQNRDFKESVMRVSLPINKKWCSKHPTGVWKQGFTQCFEGYIKEEKCEVGK